jgi:hypothetical protein
VTVHRSSFASSICFSISILLINSNSLSTSILSIDVENSIESRISLLNCSLTSPTHYYVSISIRLSHGRFVAHNLPHYPSLNLTIEISTPSIHSLHSTVPPTTYPVYPAISSPSLSIVYFL